jgi:Cu/Ag efflux pump CusA
MAYTLIGGTIGGTVLTLVFLPSLYAIWFRIKDTREGGEPAPVAKPEPLAT